MRDHTVTVFSFSKTYAQAGLRVGYTVAPEAVTVALRSASGNQLDPALVDIFIREITETRLVIPVAAESPAT